MLKKTLFASVLLAATGMAFANPAPYVGASTGIVVNSPNNSFGSSFRGIPFNLFAGYGGMISETVYLAGELTGTVATGEIQGSRYKTSYGFGGSILPGVMLSDHTMGFARAGVVTSHFSSANAYSTGGQLGLGLQTSVTQNVDVRTEYDFTAYRSVAGAAPRSDAFNLGLVYKLD